MESERKVFYHTLEPFQVPFELIAQIGYGKLQGDETLFNEIHQAEWEQKVAINSHFILHKTNQKLEYVALENEAYDAIYFDAFAPKKQPELWNETLFAKLFKATKPGGVLSTYSAAGQLKRDLKAVGFIIENPEGANGKREMTVALKPI